MSFNLNDVEDPAEPVPALSEIQGLILRGYNLNYIRYSIFTIRNVAGIQRLCKDLLPGSNALINITTAEPWEKDARPGGKYIKPPYCFNIAFTYAGLNQLIGYNNCTEVYNNSYGLFKLYQDGALKNPGIIGDKADSAPDKWWLRSGGWLDPDEKPKPDGSDLHVQISLYANNSEDRETYYQRFLDMIPHAEGMPAMEAVFEKDSDPLPAGDQYIHFGYKDSFSQPRLSKVPWNKTKERLLLGISTVDDRPIVPPYNFAISLQQGPDGPGYNAHPFLENGSFAAFRLLYQDVKAFNAFINDKKHNAGPELVAAKMCGRWFDGTPLEVSPQGPDATLKDFDYTNFNYHTPTPNQQGVRQNDDLGQLCPYAAHIRRTNPRDDTSVKGNTDEAASRRIMRRASPYGPDYDPNEPEGIQRGLIGLFICASLSQQFQFIMQTWVTQNNFRVDDKSPNRSGFDPLFGPPDDKTGAYNEFDYLPDGTPPPPYKQLTGLGRFVRTDGSMYLFLPGVTALGYISRGEIPPLGPAN